VKGGRTACTRDFEEILHLEVNATGPEQQVGAIEVKIKQVKERIRCHWKTLPGDVLRITGQHGGQQSVENRDDRESPREMFTHRKLDYKRDLSVDFGDYLQAWTPNHKTNSMHSRTNGCIALMPTGTVQGMVRFFNYTMGR